MGPRQCSAVVWAVWTTKPTLNRNDKGPGILPSFFLVPEPQQIRALNELSTTGAKVHRFAGAKISVMLAKKLPNYRFFFFAKIAFQLSL